MKALDKFEPDGRTQIVTAWAPVGAKNASRQSAGVIGFGNRLHWLRAKTLNTGLEVEPSIWVYFSVCANREKCNQKGFY